MSIDFDHITPWASSIGGLLIGLAVTIYLLGLGRIAGISGIVAGALQSFTRGGLRAQSGRFAFLLGLVAAPLLWSAFRPLPTMTSVAGTGTLLAAGLLVGIGVRMGNGCTSGHGVCGLSRFSLRSLVNVLAFIGSGVVVVTFVRHLL